jgi:hypothetical protein
MSSAFCFNRGNSSFIGQRQTDEGTKNNPRPDTPRTAPHCELKIDTYFCEKENESIYLGKRFFLMCKSCYWCASCLMDDQAYFSICPECLTDKMEWLPISQSECYKLDFDQRLGMVLQFWNNVEGGRPS